MLRLSLYRPSAGAEQATAATAVSYPPERRLSTAQLASACLHRGRLHPRQRPPAALSLYIRRGVTFWLPTMAGSVRERNLRGTPWLTMVIAEGDHPEHIAVIIEGAAEVVAPPQVPSDVRATVTGDWVSTWIRLTAERLLSCADENAQP